MKPWMRPLFPACLAVAAGCEGAPAGPLESSRAPAAAMDIGHAPPNSGPRVVRISGEPNALHLFDPETGRGVIYGFDVVQACQGPVSPELVDIQEVRGTANADRIHRLLTGSDVTTSVWPFTVFDCGLFTTVAPLGVGVADLRHTDNDVTAVLNHNVNTFGFMAHGVVTLADGTQARYHGITRCVYDGTIPPKCTERIHIVGL